MVAVPVSPVDCSLVNRLVWKVTCPRLSVVDTIISLTVDPMEFVVVMIGWLEELTVFAPSLG